MNTKNHKEINNITNKLSDAKARADQLNMNYEKLTTEKSGLAKGETYEDLHEKIAALNQDLYIFKN
jgi:hypothetical protein